MPANIPPASAEYLILHGWQNHRPEGHWQRWLAEQLGAAGHGVCYPQLPEADEPELEHWLDAIAAELEGLDPDRLIVVTHSLGGLAWIELARRRRLAGETRPLARRVLLVAPPSFRTVSGIPEIAGFAPAVPDAERAAAIAGSSREPVVVVASDADPYAPEGAEAAFGTPFGTRIVVVPGGGHLTIEEGFGPLPIVLALATAVRPEEGRRPSPGIVGSIGS